MKHTIYTWLVAFAAGMGGLCFGYEIGVMNQILSMKQFGITFGYFDETGKIAAGTEALAADRQSWITSIFLIGCVFGAAFSSRAADILSRRWSIAISGTVFAVGGILQATSTTLAQILIGRVVSGIAIGIASMSVPLYISESAPTDIRGALIAVYQLMITIGIFVATCVNSGIIAALGGTELEWRLALGIQTIPGGILTLMMLFMPFSPRWLMFRDRDSEALNVLAKIAGQQVNSEVVQTEYNQIKDSIALEREVGVATWKEMSGKGIRNRVVMAFLLQFFQQWTGINVILYYSTNIFSGMGFSASQVNIYFPLANSFINFLGTFPGMYLIDRFGRKKLLAYGGFVMAAAHFLVCLFYGLAQNNPSMYWGTIIFVYVFILGFSSTWGPVVWVYQSEIFPLRVRARGTGIATMSNWIWNAVVGNSAPRLFQSNVAGFYAYIVYGVWCVIMGLYATFLVPETMNKSLEDMDEIFGKPERSEPLLNQGDVAVGKA